jgi:hypothetical protein
LFTRLDTANYKNDGVVKVQTNIASASQTFTFYIAAQSGGATPVASNAITVEIGCYGITDVSGDLNTAYQASLTGNL